MLKNFLKLGVRLLKGPVKRHIQGIIERVAESVKESLKGSAIRWNENTPDSASSPESKAVHHSVKQGIETAITVSAAIADKENKTKDVANEAFEALSRWKDADSGVGYDVEKLEPVLKNALSLIRSARDDVAMPLLAKMKDGDFQNIREIASGLINVDLDELMSKLKTDDSEEGRLMKELVIIIVTAIAAARKTMQEELEKMGLKIF